MKCKECPYKVDNNHNRKLREFTERTGRKHTCHMVNPKLWDTSDEKQMCKGIDEKRNQGTSLSKV